MATIEATLRSHDPFAEELFDTLLTLGFPRPRTRRPEHDAAKDASFAAPAAEHHLSLPTGQMEAL
ncbi:hypothetical protein [Streptomyces virginiae]|uniref:hypothetical protein n=1 Tax=Streptomyces virginiae TaxID=1961 RepID=UPI002DC0536C|nr:hypothetical protein [Streptomyces sp. CMAA1738]MEC4569518.1 hypothetical protein [Streptomyces sp. CMAA1738]